MIGQEPTGPFELHKWPGLLLSTGGALGDEPIRGFHCPIFRPRPRA
jgi:hypothetical protein